MIAAEDKLPWLDAVCVVLPQLPYVRKQCLREGYRNNRNLLAGFCYTASEAIYHLSEDSLVPYMVRFGTRPHQTHWYLKLAETGQRIDVTASQFPTRDFASMYEFERRRAFQVDPSKRAQAVLSRITRDIYFRKEASAKTLKLSTTEAWASVQPKRSAENSNPNP